MSDFEVELSEWVGIAESDSIVYRENNERLKHFLTVTRMSFKGFIFVTKKITLDPEESKLIADNNGIILVVYAPSTGFSLVVIGGSVLIRPYIGVLTLDQLRGGQKDFIWPFEDD